MSLVPNYGSSDSESSDTESPQRQPTPKPDDRLKSKSSGLGSLLPPPKRQHSAQSSSSSKVIIDVDLPSKTESDDEEERERRAKKPKLASTASSSIADLLPPPKYTFGSKSKPVADQIPSSTLADRLQKFGAPAKPKAENEAEQQTEKHVNHRGSDQEATAVAEEEEEEQPKLPKDDPESEKFTGSFFPLGPELNIPVPPSSFSKLTRQNRQQSSEVTAQDESQTSHETTRSQTTMTTTTSNTYYDYDPNAMYSYDPNVAAQYQYWQQQQEYDYSQTGQNPNGEAVQTTVGELDDETLSRITGKRFRDQEAGIQIKTVNQEDILPSEEWRQRAQAMVAPTFKSNAAMIQATGLQKKKNNIIALAAQAQGLQERLNEQYAQNRRTKQEARRKYGF